MYEVIVVGIVAAVTFDFLNGFHDAANSIATIVGTRVLRPLYAVSIAAAANFAGPFVLGTAVAATVGKGIISPTVATEYVIIAGLIGGIVWDVITWYFGLPTSSSHALIGGLVGSVAMVAGTNGIILEGMQKVLTFMVVSPLVGLATAFALTLFIIHAFRRAKPVTVNRVFGKLQLFSSSYFSLTHGANDGMKTAGVVWLLLVTGGFATFDELPLYVRIIAAAAISAGTFFGGWRIVKTMAFRITSLQPYQGFGAETGGGIILTVMAALGIPVSTTHAISGAIMGTGATRRFSAVRWGVGKKIIWAWIITIPASAAVGAATYKLIEIIDLV